MNRIKIVVISTLVLLLLWLNHKYLRLQPIEIRDWMLSFGWIAPFLFLLLHTLRPFILFPALILSISGGLAFGVFWGTILAVIGATMGAILSFSIATFFGGQFIRKNWTGRMKNIQEQLEKRGLFYILFLRLAPGIPFDVITYAAALSKVYFRAFLLGTIFGIIPKMFAYNYLGSSMVDPELKQIGIAVSIYVASLVIPLLFRKRLEGDTYEEH